MSFPNIVLEKLSTKLANLNINYRIYYKKELESFMDFQEENNYQKYLEEGLLQVEIDKKVDLIKYKLNRLNLIDINKKLEKILEII